MTVVCGEDVPSYAIWYEFRQDRTSLEVEPQSGCPSVAVYEENCK